jgi:trimethylamine--corrinoid protein Co-methyltransferase
MFLPKDRAAKIHRASLQVLEQTGIRLDHEEAEALLLRAGARKDRSGRVLIPGTLVEKALAEAPRQVQLYDRDGRPSILLEVGRTRFGPGSDAQYNIDRQTGELRPSTLQDVADNVRLADALPGFDFIMSMSLPSDVAPAKLYPTVFAEMAKNSTKPIVTTLDDLRQIHGVASIIAGGEEVLRHRPFFVAYLEPISPLRIERSIAERILYCGQHGIPMLFAAGANCGGGAPVTPEGGVVQGSAESLAGLVLVRLKGPEARFVHGANTSAVDMRSSCVCYGAPEWFKTTAMFADMGHHYCLPSWGTAGSSDAHRPDAQAALEAYEGILLALQSQSTLVHDVGYLAYGTLYDARMLVLTDLTIRRGRHLLRPADLSKEALAVEIIDEVARENLLYMAHEHTARHFRKCLWLPPAWINRRTLGNFASEKQLEELLSDEVRRILAQHQPSPLEAGKLRQIEAFLSG